MVPVKGYSHHFCWLLGLNCMQMLTPPLHPGHAAALLDTYLMQPFSSFTSSRASQKLAVRVSGVSAGQ